MSNQDQSVSTSQVFVSTMKTVVLPVLVVVGLIAYVAASFRPAVVTSSNEPEAVAMRIQKVGSVYCRYSYNKFHWFLFFLFYVVNHFYNIF